MSEDMACSVGHLGDETNLMEYIALCINDITHFNHPRAIASNSIQLQPKDAVGLEM